MTRQIPNQCQCDMSDEQQRHQCTRGSATNSREHVTCSSNQTAKETTAFRSPSQHAAAVPHGHLAATTTPHTSFSIDDILQPTVSTRNSRTVSSSSGLTEDGSCCSTYNEDAARRSDSPRSLISEDAERDRDGSPDGSDSDMEKSSSQGMSTLQT